MDCHQYTKTVKVVVPYPELYIEYEVEIKVKTHTDYRHGEDADGNRGTSQTFIDSVEIYLTVFLSFSTDVFNKMF